MIVLDDIVAAPKTRHATSLPAMPASTVHMLCPQHRMSCVSKKFCYGMSSCWKAGQPLSALSMAATCYHAQCHACHGREEYAMNPKMLLSVPSARCIRKAHKRRIGRYRSGACV